MNPGAAQPPRGSASVEERVLALVRGLVGELRGAPPGRLTPADSLERDLGISSLERVELLTRLERAFGVRLDDDAMTAAETPRDLARFIAAGRSAEPLQRAAGPGPLAAGIGRTAPVGARTLTEALAWHAARTPAQVTLRVRRDDAEDIPLTYGELWTASVDVAQALSARGLAPGETVAIVLRTETAFFSSFFGTLIAGGVPVPLYPPFRAARIDEYVERQVAILRNAEARILITFSDVARAAVLLLGQVPSLAGVVTPDTLAAEAASIPHRAHPPGEATDPALIQYTSGSTSHPKGVVLTHANLLANIRALEARLAVRDDDVGVSWLPLYHDMGLIGAFLGFLYIGRPLALMSPLAFLARPVRWLRALHQYRGTVSPAPNFAYDLCTRRIADADLEGLDLSAVRILLNGSEAVLPESLARFIDRFSRIGLRPESVLPVYGLAECAVGLTAPEPGRRARIDSIDRARFQQTGEACPVPADASTLQLPSCGSPLPGHAVRIVDAEGAGLPDRRVGRIQFRGPSATGGYCRNPDATRDLIGPDRWLDTGDYGYLVDGELYPSGRRKDLIIKGGRNLQPHEAESVAGSIPGVRHGCVAAFGIADAARGTELFVVVAETRLGRREARDHLEAKIIERTAAAVGVPPDRVVLARPGSVLKTSSGKIRRAATRDAYLAGHLERRRRSRAVMWFRLAAQALAGGLSRIRGYSGRLAFTAWVLALLAVTVPPVALALVAGPAGPWINRLIGAWGRLLFMCAGSPITRVGREHLGRTGRAVYVVNHASYLDPVIILAVLGAPVRFAAKARLATYPLLGAMIRKGGHIPIEKADLSQKLQGASAVLGPLQAGESLCVFPEGTFVAAPGLLPFRLGAFRAAVEARCPVIPVAIRGTRGMWPAGTWLLRPGRPTVTVGAPLVPDGEAWPEMVRLRDAARTVIAQAAGEPA